MIEEPTAAQLDEIEAEGDELLGAQYEDRLLKLVTGELLVTRTLTNVEDVDPGILVIYKPAALIETRDGDVVMRQWMAESDEDYLFLPMDRVLIVTYPAENILSHYRSIIDPEEEQEITGAPEGETIH